MNETVVRSIDDLQEAANAATEQLGGCRPWFRGHANADWRLTPTVFRDSRDTAQERNLSLDFILAAPARSKGLPPKSEHFAWLGLMRHVGLPTRLLDWTESILVAAFFALTESTTGCDAAIWALDPISLNEIEYGTRHKLGSLSKGANLLARYAWDPEVGTPTGDVYTIIPQHTDSRYVAQSSMFTIHNTPAAMETREDADELLARVRIPEADREDLFLKLYQVGMRRSKLFPDSLEVLAADILMQRRRWG